MVWSAVDWDAGVIAVGSRLNRSNEMIGPKTRAAERSLRLGDDALGLLQRWRAEQEEQRALAGPAWVDMDLVASSSIGTAVSYWAIPQGLHALCERVGISPAVSPYELRHTAVSFQAEAGHSAWAIADWAGTSERMIADVYRHKLLGTSPLGPVG